MVYDEYFTLVYRTICKCYFEESLHLAIDLYFDERERKRIHLPKKNHLQAAASARVH